MEKILAKKEVSDFDKARGETRGGSPPPEPSDMALTIRELVPRQFQQLEKTLLTMLSLPLKVARLLKPQLR